MMPGSKKVEIFARNHNLRPGILTNNFFPQLIVIKYVKKKKKFHFCEKKNTFKLY